MRGRVQVGSSGTIGATSKFKGTMMAYASITLNTGAEVEGRVLARVAAVTMLANTITIPAAPSVVSLPPVETAAEKSCTARQPPVLLGDAEHFSVLAGSAIASTGHTRIIGDLGVSPGTDVTGFGPGEMLQGSLIEKANPSSAAGKIDLSDIPPSLFRLHDDTLRPALLVSA
eukprot:1086705-Rhodomonas_salina.2